LWANNDGAKGRGIPTERKTMVPESHPVEIWEMAVTVVAGVLLIVFRKPFSRLCVSSQNRTWGFKFGEREIIISQMVAIVVGAGAIIWGLALIISILMSE
jgi:hypothetical protein